MEFAKLFRSSAFASIHNNQVLKTTEELRQVGEWGLKHTTKVPFNAIYVPEVDQKLLKKPLVKSGNKRVFNLDRFKELMPLPIEIKVKQSNLNSTYGFE